ncbi:MAG: hypothetical protein U5K56_01375 [Halioglobus sp.]|nr:hypothetical protein [Halioglobus sp.]
MNLPQKIVALHHALAVAELPHAFGGALALAWCTGRARGTIDIDINIFAAVERVEAVFAALPPGVETEHKDRKIALRDGQVRLWWGRTPVDLFFNTTDFHVEAARRVRFETFMGERLPFLSCSDLAVFKAFFNRTQDWADLEQMVAAGTIDVTAVTARIIEMLGVDDERVEKLGALA